MNTEVPIEPPLARAYYWERTHPSDIFLTQPANGVARDWTWAEVMGEARRMSAYLIAQDWPTASRIVILSENCAWWIMAKLAIWMSVPMTGAPPCRRYGSTETGITHTPPEGRSKPGYVGCSTPGVETKIDDNQEVLLQSPMNMLGSFKDAEATQAVVMEDGFVRTGDMGELDAEGWLKLNGRIKEQFKTTKGKYVSPSAIEGLLSSHNAVESCLVLGSGLAAPCAVIVLSADAMESTRGAGGRRQLELALESLLGSTNGKLEHHEQLKFLAVMDSKWSVDRGFITPTLKLKRAALEAYYGPFIETWTAQGKPIVWQLDTDLRG